MKCSMKSGFFVIGLVMMFVLMVVVFGFVVVDLVMWLVDY